MKRSQLKRTTWKPKPRGYTWGLKRSRISARGRRVKAWDRVRAMLKLDSAASDRKTCELRGHPEVPHECTYDDFLGYAHDAKRRKLDAEGLKRAILICNNAHNIIEFWQPEEMKRIVNEVIAIEIY